MASSLQVYSGRLKKVNFFWKTGANAQSDPIDLTDATVSVISSSLSPKPTVSVIDPEAGHCELTFSTESTKTARKGSHNVRIAMTLTSNPGYSPDPFTLEVQLV